MKTRTIGENTRNASYLTLTEEKLGQRQKQVLDAITKKGPITRAQTAAITNLPINVVCPRVKELLEKGLIKESGVVADTNTGRPVTTLETVKHAQEQKTTVAVEDTVYNFMRGLVILGASNETLKKYFIERRGGLNEAI